MSAPILPPKHTTICSYVLARLLTGQRIKWTDLNHSHGSGRLAAQINSLKSKWEWPINSGDISVITIDGRTAIVAEYWLSSGTIAATPHRAAFVASVMAAHAARGGKHEG
jgi:hypothetical protein